MPETQFQCRLCDCRNSDGFLKRDAKSHENLAISLCQGCGLVQQTVLPSDEDLKIYYSHNYRRDYKKTYHPKPKYVSRAGTTAVHRLRFLAKYLGESDGRRLVDIGAGGGEFVYLARRAGYDASGIEPNEGYSEFAVREYGVNIETAGIEDLAESSADLITLFHVFEHLAHPLDAMERIAGALKSGGHLLVEVPNLLQKDASPHNIFFKAHLFYYSRFTLIAAASRWFEPVHVDDTGNLMILFRKRETALSDIIAPSKEEVGETISSFARKGWVQYLFQGGGLFKPVSKLSRSIREAVIRDTAPRDILDARWNKG